MVDYDRATGGGGTLRIRDDGTNVEFWLGQSFSATNSGGLPWSGTMNGQNLGGAFPWGTGGGWRRVHGPWVVSSSQTVTFNIGATGTSGFGGPTNHSAYIGRATAPARPGAPWASNVGQNSAQINWGLPSDGGSGITNVDLHVCEWQEHSAGACTAHYNWTGGAHTNKVLGGLKSGTTYYMSVRMQNGVGTGDWSDWGSFSTSNVPDKMPTPIVRSVNSTQLNIGVTNPGYIGPGPYTRRTQIATNSAFTTGVQTILDQGNDGIFNVARATKYYVRQNLSNAVGTSPWSDTLEVTTRSEIPSTPGGYSATLVTSSTAYLTLPIVSDNGGLALSDVRYQLNTVADSTGATTAAVGAFRRPFLAGLPLGTEHFIRASVKNSDSDWSAWGPWVSFTTLANTPSAPTSLTASSVLITTAALTWAAPVELNGATIEHYMLRVSPDRGFVTGVTTFELDPDDFGVALDGLQPGTQYWVQAWTVTNNGLGAFSQPISFTTNGQPPVASASWMRLVGIWKPGKLWMKVPTASAFYPGGLAPGAPTAYPSYTDGAWKTGVLWKKIDGVWRRGVA